MKKPVGGKVERREVSISLSSEVEKGAYANLATISHSPREFIFDFIFQVQNRGQVVSRIITNPQHAKALVVALTDNIAKYESQFGEIETDESLPTPVICH